MNRVVLVFLFLGLLAGASPAISGYDGIVLTDLEGNQVKVDSLLAEGPVVLNFWATWCRPCRIEMPHVEKIAADLASRKVYFAAISLDVGSRKPQVRQYVVKNEMQLPVYIDSKGEIAKRFRVAAIPTTVLLDQNGEIDYRTRGYRPGDEVLLKKKIEALLPAEGDAESSGKALEAEGDRESSGKALEGGSDADSRGRPPESEPANTGE